VPDSLVRTQPEHRRRETTVSDETGGPAPEAAQHLTMVEIAHERGRRAARDAARTNGVFVAALGLLFGALSLGVGLTEHRSPAGLVIAIALFTVLLQVVMAWRDRTRKATTRGWNRRTDTALGGTVALYTLGVVLAALELVGPRPALWVPYGLVTAFPMLAVAGSDLRRR
jgi:hypothetical protein